MKQKMIKSLLQTSAMAIVIGMMFSCTEDLEGKSSEFTTDHIVINLTESADEGMTVAKTRSVPDTEKPGDQILTSKSGKKMYLSCTETPWPSAKAATTRGAKVTTAGISNIGVSASVYSSSSSYTSAGCGSYFYKESVASGTPTKFFWPTSDYKISFFGYYPYNNAAFTVQSVASATGAPTYAYTVPSTIADQQDIMTGQVTDQLGGSSSAVNMTLSHRCSAIHFSITNNRSSAITVNSISIEGVKYSGTLNESTWTLSDGVNSSSANPFTLSYGSSVAAGVTADITGTSNIFLMLPQTLTSSAKLKMVIDSEAYEAELSGSWQAGKTYTYSVTKEPEEVIEVDLGLPSGIKWAKGNIVKDGNGGYKIGDETELGGYVDWGNPTLHYLGSDNKWENGYYFDDNYNKSITGPVTTNATYAPTSGYDAARVNLGSPWRMPTATNYKELYDNCTSEWVTKTTLSGGTINGREFTSKINGNKIFFPAGGYGTGYGKSGYGTGWCLYETSSMYSSGSRYFFSSLANSVNPQSNTGMGVGLPVRAVK